MSSVIVAMSMSVDVHVIAGARGRLPVGGEDRRTARARIAAAHRPIGGAAGERGGNQP